jgi:hypothetical protein
MDARTVPAIAADALAVNCGYCWASPASPCATDQPGGIHVARFGRAYRRGLITGADLMAVLGSLDAFTEATVVCAGAEVPS